MDKRKAIFLDRDGVINKEPPKYAHRIDQLSLYDNVIKSIITFNKLGYLVIVITNQSGVARGYYSEEDLNIFNNELKCRIHIGGGHIDNIYYCPHHPDAIIPKYRKFCECRKPNAGLLLQASKDYNIDFQKSYIIGDKITDLLAGRTVGCSTILVMTGQGNVERLNIIDEADFLCKDIFDATKIIMSRGNNENIS